jgi:hypothetical protein
MTRPDRFSPPLASFVDPFPKQKHIHHSEKPKL